MIKISIFVHPVPEILMPEIAIFGSGISECTALENNKKKELNNSQLWLQNIHTC